MPKKRSLDNKVLAGQRPRKKLSLYRLFHRLRLPLFLGLAFVGSYLLLSSLLPHLRASLGPEPVPHLFFEPQTFSLLSAAQREELSSIFHKALPLDNAKASALAKSFAWKLHAKSVTLVQISAVEWGLGLKLRKAILRSTNPSRLISTEGEAYGQAASESDRKLPIVSGIISERHTQVQEDGCLALAQEESQLLREASTLSQSLSALGIIPQSLDFIPYRGFIALLPQGIEVFFGRAPFAERPERLEKILKQQAAKGTALSRIELDFAGKAFIKEKTL